MSIEIKQQIYLQFQNCLLEIELHPVLIKESINDATNEVSHLSGTFQCKQVVGTHVEINLELGDIFAVYEFPICGEGDLTDTSNMYLSFNGNSKSFNRYGFTLVGIHPNLFDTLKNAVYLAQDLHMLEPIITAGNNSQSLLEKEDILLADLKEGKELIENIDVFEIPFNLTSDGIKQ